MGAPSTCRLGRSRRCAVDPTALRQRAWFTYSGDFPRQQGATSARQPRYVVWPLTATLIGSGQFVGLLPSSVARFNASRAGLKILAMNLPAPRVATAIITVKNRTLSSLAKLFIECGRKVAAAITAPTKRKTLRSI